MPSVKEISWWLKKKANCMNAKLHSLMAWSYFEEYYPPGYNTVQSTEKLMFCRNISPPSFSLKNKPSRIPAWKQVASMNMSVNFSNGLLSIVSQKIALFITTSMSTSNPTLNHFSCINLEDSRKWDRSSLRVLGLLHYPSPDSIYCIH